MSKERLEEIKKKYNYERLGEFIDAKPVNSYELKRLIQQAETLQKIRTGAEDLYNEEIDLMDFGERVVNIL